MKVTKVLNVNTNKNVSIDKKQFKDWMKALRSGKYGQATGALEKDGKFCCLGVACKLLVDEKFLNVRKDTGDLIGEWPDEQRKAPKWLRAINDDFSARQERYDAIDSSYFIHNIGDMNDSERLSFDEIADVLELVYVHGMLEEE